MGHIILNDSKQVLGPTGNWGGGSGQADGLVVKPSVFPVFCYQDGDYHVSLHCCLNMFFLILLHLSP